MTGRIELLDAFAGAWLDALMRASWQGGLALAGAWALCRFLPRLSPTVQCWLWRLAYVRLLLSLFWATPIDVPVLPPREQTPAAITPTPVLEERATREIAPRLHPKPRRSLPNLREPAPAHPNRRPASNRPAVWLFLLWGTGTVTLLVRLATLCRESRRLRQTTVPVTDASLATDFERVCRLLEVARPPALLESREAPAPMLTGIWKPAVVLPDPGPAGGTEDVRLMLAHELGHLRRADLCWAWLPTLARCLFFFHPAVWLAHREWVAATEAACDELVLTATKAAPARYATMLLTVATRWSGPSGTSPATVSIVGCHRSLRRRIEMLRTVRPISHTRLRRAALVVALIGPAALVPWRVVASPPGGSPPIAGRAAAGKDPAGSRPPAKATPRPAQAPLPLPAAPKPPRPEPPISMVAPPAPPAAPAAPTVAPVPAPLPLQALAPPPPATAPGSQPGAPGLRIAEDPAAPPSQPGAPAPPSHGPDKAPPPPAPPAAPDAGGVPVLKDLPLVGRLFQSPAATNGAQRLDGGAPAKDLVIEAYRLQQIEAEDLRHLLFQESGVPSGVATIAADRRTNTLLAQGSSEGIQTLKLGIALGDVRVEAEGDTYKVRLKPGKVDAPTLQRRVLGLIGSGRASVNDGTVELRGNREWVLRGIGLAMSLEMGGIQRRPTPRGNGFSTPAKDGATTRNTSRVGAARDSSSGNGAASGSLQRR